jgi:hypothetical protein
MQVFILTSYSDILINLAKQHNIWHSIGLKSAIIGNNLQCVLYGKSNILHTDLRHEVEKVLICLSEELP